MNYQSSKTISRRGFIGTSTASLDGLTIVPCSTVSESEHIAPNGKEIIADREGKIKTSSTELAASQDANGRWPEPPERGYRDYSCGIPWLLLRMDELIGPNPVWKACARKFMDGLATTDGERYYGLYVRPFTNGLAWLSACEAVYKDIDI